MLSRNTQIWVLYDGEATRTVDILLLFVIRRNFVFLVTVQLSLSCVYLVLVMVLIFKMLLEVFLRTFFSELLLNQNQGAVNHLGGRLDLDAVPMLVHGHVMRLNLCQIRESRHNVLCGLTV